MKILNIIGDYDFIMKISKNLNAKANNLPLINYRVHQKNFSKLNSKMFYDEYKLWFEKNLHKSDNDLFLCYKIFHEIKFKYS